MHIKVRKALIQSRESQLNITLKCRKLYEKLARMCVCVRTLSVHMLYPFLSPGDNVHTFSLISQGVCHSKQKFYPTGVQPHKIGKQISPNKEKPFNYPLFCKYALQFMKGRTWPSMALRFFHDIFTHANRSTTLLECFYVSNYHVHTHQHR